ncbi:MAG: putative ABC transporter permease, partial [Clostridiales bacterium]|nr:putative ABC transporter permease [Clostridiales bacterium]
MGAMSFSNWVLLFLFYSAIGWICESIWCSIGTKKIVNRGFLYGPWCPVYGFGAIIAIAATGGIKEYPVLVFLVIVVACSALEYFTGWLMETLFKATWWDYSKRKCNIKGRVCLRNSLLFGVMGLGLIYGIHPFAMQLISPVPAGTMRFMTTLLLVVFFFDFIYSVLTLSGFQEKLAVVKEAYGELEEYQNQYKWYDKKDIEGSFSRLQKISLEHPENEATVLLIEKINKQKGEGKNPLGRYIKAYPKMISAKVGEEFSELKEVWVEKKTERKEKKRTWSNKIKTASQKEWKRVKASYHDVTFMKMTWVFIIGGVVGFVVETLWCLVTRGVIESRQGLVYGPFSQVYALGAVVIVLVLTPFVDKGDGWLFGIGAVVGGLYEGICSFVQELTLGSVSWEYGEFPFSFLNGRTNLLYMCFWGILTIVYMKHIYPAMLRLINRSVAKRPRNIFTWIVVLLLVADMGISALAVGRWSERINQVPGENTLQIWLDTHY